MGPVVFNPEVRAALERRGLSRAEDFLRLQGVILGGHPGRHVQTIDLGPELGRCFLKKDHRIRWKDRLVNAWAGFGWVAKSVREARVLEQAGRAGMGCPEIVAAAECQGRAFVLLRAVEHAVELREYLATAKSPQARRTFAAWLGTELAKVLLAGFVHPDCYSKHVLIQTAPAGPRLVLVDWQRAYRVHRLSRRAMINMLAALDVTTAAEFASDPERLRCLAALLRMFPGSWPLPGMAKDIRRRSQALKSRRRIREMAQPPLAVGQQNLIWLDGEALCVTREFQAEMGPTPPRWLQPSTLAHGASKLEEVRIPWKQRRLRLLRHWSPRPWFSPRRRSFPAPEFEQAAALFRLERFRLPLPRLLAVGHRVLEHGGRYAFLLTEPLPGAKPLADFLAQETSLQRRGNALRLAGALLGRLHEAGYGFRGGQLCPWQGWAVQEPAPGDLRIVLDHVQGLAQQTAARPRLAYRDLRTGCAAFGHRPDALRFLLGYWNVKRLRGQARACWKQLRPAWRRPAGAPALERGAAC